MNVSCNLSRNVLAILWRDKLHEIFHSVTYPTTAKIVARQVARTVAKSRIKFYFSCNAKHFSVTAPLRTYHLLPRESTHGTPPGIVFRDRQKPFKVPVNGHKIKDKEPFPRGKYEHPQHSIFIRCQE